MWSTARLWSSLLTIRRGISPPHSWHVQPSRRAYISRACQAPSRRRRQLALLRPVDLLVLAEVDDHGHLLPGRPPDVRKDEARVGEALHELADVADRQVVVVHERLRLDVRRRPAQDPLVIRHVEGGDEQQPRVARA
jgi:hypothetical protein